MGSLRLRRVAVSLIAPLLVLAAACAPSPAPAQPAAAPAPKPAAPAAAPQPTAAPAAPAQPAAAPAAPAQPAAQPTAAPAAAAKPAAPAAGQPATLGPGPKLTIAMLSETNPTYPLYKEIVQPYATQIIPQRSNGRIDVKLATLADVNLSGPDVFRVLMRGQFDIARPDAAMAAGELPLIEAADLAGLTPGADTTRKAMAALVPTLNKELERFDVQLLSSAPNPGSMVFSKKPLDKGLDSFKGMKVRTYGPSLNDLFGALGAEPVSVAYAEVYSALERGVVDAAITGTANANTAKWFEVSNYLYDLTVSWGAGYYAANTKWWAKLDPDVRTFLAATFAEMEGKMWARATEITQEGVDASIGKEAKPGLASAKDHPMKDVKPTPEDLARIKKILEDNVIPGFVKRTKDERYGQVYNDILAPITGVKYVKK